MRMASPMTDYFAWLELRLGRWLGVPVRIHGLFSIFVILTLLSAALDEETRVSQSAAWLLLLIVAVGMHELGHALNAAWLGGEPDEVRLWPLGNFQGPSPVPGSRWAEAAWTAAAGPLVSLGLALSMAIALHVADATMVFYPFGNGEGTGAPILADGSFAPAFSTIWWIGWFGYLNWLLFLVNLIPALPLDGGRALRAYLARPSLVHRDSLIAPHTSWAMAAVLFLVGLARLIFWQDPVGGMTLIALAILIGVVVRLEARMLEDGGYLDDSLFGYDFSDGYTSLESSAQKVRPYRESALKRWRRRRSDLRRQRRQALEAAEDARMDEILAKLHGQGRASLTDEEQRFLIRVSVKYRNRPKARG